MAAFNTPPSPRQPFMAAPTSSSNPFANNDQEHNIRLRRRLARPAPRPLHLGVQEEDSVDVHLDVAVDRGDGNVIRPGLVFQAGVADGRLERERLALHGPVTVGLLFLANSLLS